MCERLGPVQVTRSKYPLLLSLNHVYVCIVFVQQTQEEWRWVFFLAALIFVLGFIFFLIFGSGEIEPWAVEQEEFEINTDNEKSSPLTQEMTDLDGVKEMRNGTSVINNGSSHQLEEEGLLTASTLGKEKEGLVVGGHVTA